MIVPSIDIVGGTTVQLVGGEAQALDAGDPFVVLERFARVGEVAVVDIDAARGEGSNAAVIEEMCRMAPIRVGGGIRDVATAMQWLDAGAAKVIIGTAAEEDLLSQIPKDRLIVALDARDGEVVTHGWRESSGRSLLESVRRFAGLSDGFLVTFVEREGRMSGTDLELAGQVVEAAGSSRVTIAGGITTADEVAQLDRIGADAQIGMALYTGRLGLAEAFAAPIISDRQDNLWPTVVVDERDVALGLAYSDLASLEAALDTGQGAYHSRTRGLWVKGETSGATQELIDVAVDCDRDTLRFRVRQNSAFCHQETRSCWGDDRGLGRLERRLRAIAVDRPVGSNTVRLLDDPDLLAAKIREEVEELIDPSAEVMWEAADVVYFALVKSVAAGVSLEDIEKVLDRRERIVTRRPMRAKEGE